MLSAVRAICISTEDKKMLIGTLGSEIYEVHWATDKITPNTQFEVKVEAMKGHFCPNLKWTNEVWGLDIFKKDADKFATCSDDGTIRVWSVS